MSIKIPGQETEPEARADMEKHTVKCLTDCIRDKGGGNQDERISDRQCG